MNMEFVRGDGANHAFYMPASSWQAGGRLWFAAKVQIDDDLEDTTAQVRGNWGDASITDVTRVVNGVSGEYKRYACTFLPAATTEIVSNGAGSLELLGEFQWVPSGGGSPITFPGNDVKIPVIVYFDIVRDTVL